MSCTCHGCGEQYTVDIDVPDSTWEIIKPTGSPMGAGMLCGRCIFERIESTHSYAAYTLTRHNHKTQV